MEGIEGNYFLVVETHQSIDFRAAATPVNSNTTGTITPMFSSYDWMKPNLKQKAGTWREPRWENGLFERTGESYEE